MAHLAGFSVDDLVAFSDDLRTIGAGAADMAEVAGRVTEYLYEGLVSDDGEPECLTVALYKTHRFGSLPPELQRLAHEVDAGADDATACLTRLAVAGFEQEEPEPASFVRPLTAAAFDEAPVLVEVLVSLGLEVESALDPTKALQLQLHHRDLNVFLVPELLGSSWFAEEEAQAQIAALGIRSLLGVGGALPSGDLFLLFLFSFVPIDDRDADMVRSLASAVKASLIPFTLRPFA